MDGFPGEVFGCMLVFPAEYVDFARRWARSGSDYPVARLANLVLAPDMTMGATSTAQPMAGDTRRGGW